MEKQKKSNIIGMVGNTGYFGNNNCYSQKFSAQPIITRDLF